MKIKITIALLLLFCASNIALAQPKVIKARSIISTNSSIKTYNERKGLEAMNKGELIELYKERIKLLINILPNIALATKPGISMTDIGIPDTTENRKALDAQIQGTNDYITNTAAFQSSFLPFSDKSNIINCILFYESTLKALNVLGDTE